MSDNISWYKTQLGLTEQAIEQSKDLLVKLEQPADPTTLYLYDRDTAKWAEEARLEQLQGMKQRLLDAIRKEETEV